MLPPPSNHVSTSFLSLSDRGGVADLSLFPACLLSSYRLEKLFPPGPPTHSVTLWGQRSSLPEFFSVIEDQRWGRENQRQKERRMFRGTKGMWTRARQTFL